MTMEVDWAGALSSDWPRRFDQHVDGAGGGGELAPSLVVDRDAVLEALGAGQALEVAGIRTGRAGGETMIVRPLTQSCAHAVGSNVTLGG